MGIGPAQEGGHGQQRGKIGALGLEAPLYPGLGGTDFTGLQLPADRRAQQVGLQMGERNSALSRVGAEPALQGHCSFLNSRQLPAQRRLEGGEQPHQIVDIQI